MFSPLLGAVRADINRQVGWAKGEVRRRSRHVIVVGVRFGLAALAEGSGPAVHVLWTSA